jgi:hypothetical protein
MTEEKRNEININRRKHRAAMTDEQRSEVNRKQREAYHKKKANSKNDKLSKGDILSVIMSLYL